MIFITVGTQLAFPRLLAMFVEAVPEQVPGAFAQTADPAYDGPIPSAPFLSREEFEESFERAELIVGHAGTGTILAARRHRKPLIVVPRRFHLGEHRNDHQFGTAMQLRELGEGTVCETAGDLADAIASRPQPSAPRKGPEYERLIANLTQIIAESVNR